MLTALFYCKLNIAVRSRRRCGATSCVDENHLDGAHVRNIRRSRRPDADVMTLESPTCKSLRVSDKESKSVRTRTRILDAAARVLSTKGYAGTRLSDVAKAADLRAPPAIYYYFDSRETLIEEVMWSGVADMRHRLEDALDEISPPT